MSQPDTYCADCRARFRVGPHGNCPECSSRQVRRAESLDWVEVTCQRIAAELRTLEPLSSEEARLVEQAVSALTRPQERAGEKRASEVLWGMGEALMRLQARGGVL